MPTKTGFKTGSSASTAYDIAGNFVTQDYVSETYPNLSSNVRGGGLAVAGRWQQGGTIYTTPYQFQGGQWKKVIVAAGQNGYAFSYWAIKSDGTLWGWGNNYYGQLGLGDTTDRSTPTQISSATDWVDLGCNSAYEVAFYALKSNGTMYSCGYNMYSSRNLINGSNTTTLTAVSGTWKKIISHDGENLIYFIDSNNVAYGTGVQYGAGEFPISPGGGSYQAYQPTALLQDPAGVNADVKTVKSHLTNNCTVLIKNSGQAWIWYYSLTAVQAAGSDWKDGAWKFLVKKDGTLWCLDMANISAAPVQTNIAGVRTIFQAEQFFYVIKTDGSLWWFKTNIYNANQYKISTTAQITSIELETSMYFNVNCAGLRGYWNADTALNKYNVVVVADAQIQDNKPLGFKYGSTVSDAIDVGNVFVKRDALDTTRTLFGSVNYVNAAATYMLGNDGAASTSMSRIGSSFWKKVHSSDGTAIGIKSDGTLWRWGQAKTNINPTATSTPTLLSSDTDWVDCLSHPNFIAAVKKDGTVYNAGTNDWDGGMARGTANNSGWGWGLATALVGRNIKKIIRQDLSAGVYLTTNGDVYAYGSFNNAMPNSNAQVAANLTASARLAGVLVLSDIEDIVLTPASTWYRKRSDGLWRYFGYDYAFYTTSIFNPRAGSGNFIYSESDQIVLPDEYQFVKLYGHYDTYFDMFGIKKDGSLWNWGGIAGIRQVGSDRDWKDVGLMSGAIGAFAGLKTDGGLYSLNPYAGTGTATLVSGLPPIRKLGGQFHVLT